MVVDYELSRVIRRQGWVVRRQLLHWEGVLLNEYSKMDRGQVANIIDLRNHYAYLCQCPFRSGNHNY